MARRVRNSAIDRRDWVTRADEAVVAATAMPAGPSRDEALRKAAELRRAGEMMGYLTSSELKPLR